MFDTPLPYGSGMLNWGPKSNHSIPATSSHSFTPKSYGLLTPKAHHPPTLKGHNSRIYSIYMNNDDHTDMTALRDEFELADDDDDDSSSSGTAREDDDIEEDDFACTDPILADMAIRLRKPRLIKVHRPCVALQAELWTYNSSTRRRFLYQEHGEVVENIQDLVPLLNTTKQSLYDSNVEQLIQPVSQISLQLMITRESPLKRVKKESRSDFHILSSASSRKSSHQSSKSLNGLQRHHNVPSTKLRYKSGGQYPNMRQASPMRRPTLNKSYSSPAMKIHSFNRKTRIRDSTSGRSSVTLINPEFEDDFLPSVEHMDPFARVKPSLTHYIKRSSDSIKIRHVHTRSVSSGYRVVV